MISIRPVCYLDVLGFRQKIETMSLYELSEKYRSFIQAANLFMKPLAKTSSLPTLFPEHVPGQPYCTGHIFSDSMIFAAHSETANSSRELLYYVWRLMQTSLFHGLPMRGAIACDEMYINQNEGAWLGRALTSAYDLEQKQNWVGVAIDPSVEEHYPDTFNDPWADLLFPYYHVPMKCGHSVAMRVINWRFNLIAQCGTRSFFAPSGDRAAAEKVSNTLEFARHVVGNGRIYCWADSTPAEIRPYYAGDREPPFDHGDEL